MTTVLNPWEQTLFLGIFFLIVFAISFCLIYIENRIGILMQQTVSESMGANNTRLTTVKTSLSGQSFEKPSLELASDLRFWHQPSLFSEAVTLESSSYAEPPLGWTMTLVDANGAEIGSIALFRSDSLPKHNA
jgi:hypothetical protein